MLWHGSEIDFDRDVRVSIDLTDLARAAESLLAAGHEATSIGREDMPLDSARAVIDEVRRRLTAGPGMVILDGFAGLPVELAELVFWRLGLELGTPLSQSVMGERIGHVIDHTDVDPDARAYRRSERLTPHTDPADFLAFLCLHSAAEGGDNVLASSMTVHELMRRDDPDLLERLWRGYRYHRFGEQGIGDDPITPYRVPVFSEVDGLVSCTYVRQYIEIAAAEEPSCGLDDLDHAALDEFERLATDPEHAARFRLEAGEVLLANNFTVLHARDDFRDEPGAPRRHLVRLWLQAHDPRPVVAETSIYVGGPGIPAQPGRTPSYRTDVEVI
jgi:hypothetical protein